MVSVIAWKTGILEPQSSSNYHQVAEMPNLKKFRHPGLNRMTRAWREKIRWAFLKASAPLRYPRLLRDGTAWRLSCRRILVIRVDGIGDMIMTLPTIRALRRYFPEAEIDVITRPWSAPLLSEPGLVNQIFTAERGAPSATRGKASHSKRGLINHLRRRRYDLAIDIAGRDIARRMAFFSGARRCAGPADTIYDALGVRNYSFLLSHPIAMPEDTTAPRHPVDNFLFELESLGLTASPAVYDLPIPAEATQVVKDALSERGIRGRFAVIHPCSSNPFRNWSEERFARVVEHLAQHHDLDVVITGSERDTAYVESLARSASCHRRTHIMAGVFSLLELAALYRHAQIMVTVDTGPMHIADAVGTPLVALFLPWFVTNRPYRQKDAVVQEEGVPEFSSFRSAPPDAESVLYLNRITVTQVIDAVDRKLAKHSNATLSQSSHSH